MCNTSAEDVAQSHPLTPAIGYARTGGGGKEGGGGHRGSVERELASQQLAVFQHQKPAFLQRVLLRGSRQRGQRGQWRSAGLQCLTAHVAPDRQHKHVQLKGLLTAVCDVEAHGRLPYCSKQSRRDDGNSVLTH